MVNAIENIYGDIITNYMRGKQGIDYMLVSKSLLHNNIIVQGG